MAITINVPALDLALVGVAPTVDLPVRDDPPLAIEPLADLPTAAYPLIVSVSNVVPGATVHFDVEGEATDIYEAVADSTGALVSITVPVPATLVAGLYVLVARTDDAEGEETFIVQASPDVYPEPPEPDTLPTDPATVARWTVIDPVDGSTWEIPYNPQSITTPHAPKAYDYETTTAPSGTVLTWEGASDPVSWRIRGYIDTEAFYEALVGYLGSNRRYVVVDHRGRAWVVLFESFDPTPHRAQDNDWSFDYELGMLILSGVTL